MLTAAPPLPTVKIENARQGYFEADVIARVLEHLPEDIAPAIELAYYTGWRIGEIRKLTWTNHLDVDASAVLVRAGETKNEAGRRFPFDQHQLLRALIARQCERAFALGVLWLFPPGGWQPTRHLPQGFGRRLARRQPSRVGWSTIFAVRPSGASSGPA